MDEVEQQKPDVELTGAKLTVAAGATVYLAIETAASLLIREPLPVASAIVELLQT